MPLQDDLLSTDFKIIYRSLLTVLDELVAPEILELDQQFKQLKTPQDKHAFFRAFESTVADQRPRDSHLLERFTHYCWIRLELLILSEQRATLNQFKQVKTAVGQHCAHVEGDLPAQVMTAHEAASLSFQAFQARILEEPLDKKAHLSLPLESLSLAIAKGREAHLEIQAAIQILRKMNLQIVGTEHPTDPLSQKARETLIQLSQSMESQTSTMADIKKLLQALWTVDAIPYAKRTVVEEVNRNIHITLSPLYDNIPVMIEEILAAFRLHYGAAAVQHEEEILQAIEGGGSIEAGSLIPPLFKDASWPGFDADGNENITPGETANAIRLYRIRVAEKHIQSLEAGVIAQVKEVERQLREALTALGTESILCVLGSSDLKSSGLLTDLIAAQKNISDAISNRTFFELKEYYESLLKKLEGIDFDQVSLKSKLRELLEQQSKLADQLVELTQFSGKNRTRNGQAYVDCDGDLQKFIRLFENYKQAVLYDSDAIEIEDADRSKVLVSQYIRKEYERILTQHATFLEAHPEIKRQFRYFGVQLRCFGLTYGVGHVRQDSSIFTRVWTAIFEDLKQDSSIVVSSGLGSLRGQKYSELEASERAALHQRLQNGSPASKALLDIIFHKHKNGYYAAQAEPDFYWVQSELDRLKLVLRHQDLFENLIISNSESAANILELDSLLQVFPAELQAPELRIVPLLEKRKDLEKCEEILLGYIQAKVWQKLDGLWDHSEEKQQTLKQSLRLESREQLKSAIGSKQPEEFLAWLDAYPEFKQVLESITIEVMLGFSDTERVSGMSALIFIQQVQEQILRLAQSFGVMPKIYYGPGGDINRGGAARNDQKATLQGSARQVLSTGESVAWFRERQFYQTYLKMIQPGSAFEIEDLEEDLAADLKVCAEAGAGFFEHLHDVHQGLGQLFGLMLGHGSHWMVSILNSSSRAAQRGVMDKMGDRTAAVQSQGDRPPLYIHPDKPRAITATQMQEMLQEYLDCIGPCVGLRRIGLKKSRELYQASETFRDMVEKESMAVTQRDLSLLEHALFGEDSKYRPKDAEEQEAWARECRDAYPDQLKRMDIQKMSQSSDPKVKDQLLLMLSRLLAYIAVECRETEQFLLQLKQSIQLVKDGSVIHHNPVLAEQIATTLESAEPLSYLFARQVHQVAAGACLDQVYPDLRQEGESPRCLSQVGKLLANVGAGITACRSMHYAWREPWYAKISRHEASLPQAVKALPFLDQTFQSQLEAVYKKALAQAAY